MPATKQNKLKWIKGLMLFSQALIVVFAVQWLISQYNERQAQLKQNLTELFTDVQQRISDSLLMTNVYDTSVMSKIALAGTVQAYTSDSMTHVRLSKKGAHSIMAGTSISSAEQKKLFGMDSILFNDMFAAEMRKNGWFFNSEWINNSDSDKAKASREIFIRSNFFTDAKGVVVKDYRGYIMGRMVTPSVFVLLMLSLTAAAFIIAYRSLKAQIKLSLLKDDFISNMSHELKTPIATVKVALEALSNYNIIDNPKLNREYLGMATSEMDRLELLATRVLNTSLLETGKIYLEQVRYDLRRLVDEVLQTMQLRVQQHNAKVTFDVTGSNFMIAMDKLHMQGVLVNLLDNSLKYGEKPIRIHIELKEASGAVQLAFKDNGPGIPEEYKEKVFEKFFRVPTGNRHNTKGYGLGLSYAAQVMRQHNGSIYVNNVAEGGCVFTLTF
jgi:signal transduction histidine kinase